MLQEPVEALENPDVDVCFPSPDGDGTENGYHRTVTMQNPLISSTAPPERDLPPVVADCGFTLPEPPASGYIPGCYLPSPPRPLLPPLGHLNGASTFTSWSSYPHPTPFSSHEVPNTGGAAVSQPYGAPYSMFPSLCGGDYNATAPYLHHPISDPTVTSTRKRPREDDSNIPAKNIGAGAVLASELPTPPDSCSERSDSGSPHYLMRTPLALQIPMPYPPPPMQQEGVIVSLTAKCEEMWNLFYAANTEMIVTKSGRCLFPVLMFQVSGLSRKKEYNVYLRAVLNDCYRYKYLHNTWTQVAESDITHDEARMITKHPSSPQSGAKWMAKDIDFKSAKITHYPKSKGGDIFLHTMHKYFFEMVVEEFRSDSEPLVFPFRLTRFVAVTAYQSAKLTELKKEKNPFARGVKRHDSETDTQIQSICPQGVPNYNLLGYSSTAPVYPSVSSYSGTHSVPYPTPWSQH